MLTSEDYFNIINSRNVNKNINNLDERKYEPDEKLPSGRTPNQKMSRAQMNLGARYMTEPSPSRFADRRLDTTKSSSLDRGRKNKDIQDVIKSGQDPRNATIKSKLDGKEIKNVDLRKRGRPGVTPEDRASRTVRDDEISVHTQGGLRAHKTKAGGYRKKIRKEDFDIIKEYLFVEGYADTLQGAEKIAKNIGQEWINDIINEAGKVLPYGPVADKMRQLDGEIKSSKSPKEKEKLRKRLDKIGDQYWQPN